MVGRGGGTGTFTQSSGTVRGSVSVGSGLELTSPLAAGTGYYTLATGLLEGSVYVGDGGTGTFTQNGGTVAYDDLWIGNVAGSQGHYCLGGGVVRQSASSTQSGDIYINGYGTLAQTGGALTLPAGAYLWVGCEAGPGALYEVQGGALSGGDCVYVGETVPGRAVQSSGTVTTPVFVDRGSWELSGGRIDAALSVGATGGYASTVTHSAGIKTGPIWLGPDAGSSGTYVLKGTGQIHISGQHESVVVGDYGAGRFVQQAGAVLIDDVAGSGLVVGWDSTSSGTYELSGGSLTAPLVRVAIDGAGRFTQSGGAVAVTDQLAVYPDHAGGVGLYELQAGSATATSLLVGGDGGSSGTFNWTGGTLKAGTIKVSTGGKFAVGITATHGGDLHGDGGSLDVAAGKRFTVCGTFGEVDDAQSLTKTGPGILTVAGPQSHRTGAVLGVAAGTVELNTDAGGAAKTFDLTLNVWPGAAASLGATQHLAALNLGAAASVKVAAGAAVATKSLEIVGGAAPTAALDLGKGLLAVDYPDGATSPLAGIRQWIICGRNGGAWDGNGITSSDVAASLPLATWALGYAENGNLRIPYTTFGAGDPVAVDNSSVLVRYTYAGDLNLDGRVDDDDVSVLALCYDGGKTAGRTWAAGDVALYDGLIDDDDVSVLAMTYGLGWTRGTLLADGSGPALAKLGAAAGAAPEPATLALLALGGLSLMARARKRR